MRRTLLTVLLVLAVIWSAAPPTPAIEAATNLSGSITANTVLTQANSPYLVTGTVVVEPGVTLTIEPGVRVEFDALAGLEIRGTLTAQGTSASRIVFTGSSGGTVPTWRGITVKADLGGRAEITFADVSNASGVTQSGHAVVKPLHVADSTFRYNSRGVNGFGNVPSTVERTLFENNTAGVADAGWKISDSTFRNNMWGVHRAESVEVVRSTFTGNEVAINLSSGIFKGNTFTNNVIVVDNLQWSAVSMTYNTISDNQSGVVLNELELPGGLPRFQFNNLTNNGSFSYKVWGPNDHAAPNNWWGTTDLALAAATVIDANDQAGLGRVALEPMLSAPVDITNYTAPPVLPTATATQPPTPSSTLSGSIFTDTTLRLASSPYRVTGDVVAYPEVTFTIEPGVRIEFDPGTRLEVRGPFIAEGTAASRIVFTGTGGGTNVTWDGVSIGVSAGASSSIKFADFSNAQTAISASCCSDSAPLRITDSTFRHNSIALYGYYDATVVVERAVFENNERTVMGGLRKKISNSTFRNNLWAFFNAQNNEVSSSTFTGNHIAINVSSGTFTGNTITNNVLAVNSTWNDLAMTYNTITNNDAGVELAINGGAGAVSGFQFNNVTNNREYNFKAFGSDDRVVPNNWWGTTNTVQIDATIVDKIDQSGLGRVNYLPMLSGPVDIVNRTAPAAVTPTLTPTMTAVPTGTPVPTMTPSQTPTLTGPATLSCNPRPKIYVETVRDGQNRLKVTLTANPAQTNGLVSVTIGAATNAIVEAGQPATAVTSTLPLTGKPVSTTFYVRRIDPNAAATVQLIVQDGCGEWKTFVGGGAGSF